MTNIKRRAVRNDQKLERRQVLIDRAWVLFQQQSYEQINIIDVARSAGLAKGTVYLYFRTKEALFLAVLIDQFTHWFDQVDQVLPALGIEGVVGVIHHALIQNPHLVRLFAIVHVVLEQNIDYDNALTFKRFLLERVGRTGRLIEQSLMFLKAGEGGQLLLRAYALVIGVQHLADPAPVVSQVLLTEPGLEVFRIRFSTEFPVVLTALLRGLQSIQSEE
jgi:AcrR family transcriptional regulator